MENHTITVASSVTEERRYMWEHLIILS